MSDRPGDGPRVTCERVGEQARPVVERLAQLERHDLSGLGGWVPGDDGLFEVPRLHRFFDEPDHDAYLVRSDDALAGFALVRPFEDGAHFIHSFFVVRSLRRHGVGRAAAGQLIRGTGGLWAIAFLEEYAAAGAFWRTVARDVAGQRWTEGRRTSPDEKQVFSWIEIDLPHV
ncbi:MAG: GNAT family N-acetyltransferase [Candidatus Nanopelagicales bacterium]